MGARPGASYCEFMPGRLIAIDKQPGVRPVGFGETWRRLFAKIVLKFIQPESTLACQYDKMCSVLKVVIDGTVHETQAIWEKNSTTED